MLHHTGSNASDDAICKYLAYNPAQVSCHFVVWKRGQIYQLADYDKITWHAWESRYDWKTWLNKYAIGIEVHSDWYNYSNAQRDAVRWLINKIMSDCDIAYTNIIRHKDVTNRKRDIGDNFRNNAFIDFEAYKKSYRLNTKEIALREQVMKLNSELWEETSDLELRHLLHDTNNYLRG